MKNNFRRLAYLTLVPFLMSSCSKSVYQGTTFNKYENVVSQESFLEEYGKRIDKNVEQFITHHEEEYYDEEDDEMKLWTVYEFNKSFEVYEFYSGYSKTIKDGKQTHEDSSIDETNMQVDNVNKRAKGVVKSSRYYIDKERDKEEEKKTEKEHYYEGINESTVKAIVDGKSVYLNETPWYDALTSTAIFSFQTTNPINYLHACEYYYRLGLDWEEDEDQEQIDQFPGTSTYYQDDNIFTWNYVYGNEETRIQTVFNEDSVKVITRMYVKGNTVSSTPIEFTREYYGILELKAFDGTVEKAAQ